MKVFQTVVEIQKHLLEINGFGNKSVGFVPTMGALHEGHISLIKASKIQAATTVCSIFVNPTQFNDISDFEKYPIQLDRDLEMLLEAGCDVVFVPSFEEIYPNGVLQKTEIDLGFIGTTLEGAHRPGHFEGVVQVVKRLLDIIQPDYLFLGQKDYQQSVVISKLIAYFHLPVKLVVCETLREKDGLAMSSRNVRLNDAERKSAIKLSQTIFYIRDHLAEQPVKVLIDQQLNYLAEDPQIHVEYIEVVDSETLQPISEVHTPATVLIAAKVGPVRLIDNVLLN